MAEKKPSFEQAVAKLEEISARLRSDELSLEESSALYEESVKYFELCDSLLEKAKQKIEIYRPEAGKTEDFEK